ncbi:MAG: RHS repeat-associated core domain-containing protein [Vicinamibacterales bacterium]
MTETRADGTTQTTYTYDLTGRLATVTDPKAQVTTHTYLADDSLSSTVYTNAVIATPSVSYTYDPVYARVATMGDGIGTTSYTYKAPGQLGAGQVATVDGPLTNDVIAYTYSALGRVVTRTINGVANSVTWAFDALGRVTSEQNVLGTFTYGYDGVTSRLATVSYPNGQTSTYSYLPNSQDHRLQTIHHQYPNLATLSKFDYTYDAVGNILTWRQQADSTATLWSYGYDAADQLTRAVQWSTDPTPVVLKRYAYTYDPAGNRTSEQIDDAITMATHDSLNRLVSQAPGGAIAVAGSVNEPATVRIQGQPATVDSTNAFRGTAPTASGTNTFTITATDPSGNMATQAYQVNQGGTSDAFTYDLDGNMTSDGTRTFEWDAKNELVSVTQGSQREDFAYDGSMRRVRATVTADGVVTSDARTVWCGTRICEDRDASTNLVERRVSQLGVQIGGVDSYFAGDHLTTARVVTDGAGATVAKYDTNPWGRRSVPYGTDFQDASLVGHRWAEVSELSLSLYRGYRPDLGRWLNEDPDGTADGLNQYRLCRQWAGVGGRSPGVDGSRL